MTSAAPRFGTTNPSRVWIFPELRGMWPITDKARAIWAKRIAKEEAKEEFERIIAHRRRQKNALQMEREGVRWGERVSRSPHAYRPLWPESTP